MAIMQVEAAQASFAADTKEPSLEEKEEAVYMFIYIV